MITFQCVELPREAKACPINQQTREVPDNANGLWLATVQSDFCCLCTVVFGGEILAAPEKTSHAFGAALKLNARIPGDAWTSKSLGTAREGHAVVIDSNGLVVTIGYLILEAEAVTLTTNDGREVLVEILAHDHDTGFGLV